MKRQEKNGGTCLGRVLGKWKVFGECLGALLGRCLVAFGLFGCFWFVLTRFLVVFQYFLVLGYRVLKGVKAESSRLALLTCKARDGACKPLLEQHCRRGQATRQVEICSGNRRSRQSHSQGLSQKGSSMLLLTRKYT